MQRRDQTEKWARDCLASGEGARCYLYVESEFKGHKLIYDVREGRTRLLNEHSCRRRVARHRRRERKSVIIERAKMNGKLKRDGGRESRKQKRDVWCPLAR